MDILDIRGQRLSTLLADFMVCKSCGIVDRDQERTRLGYKCPRCGIPGERAREYFPISVNSLIDLMQESYHLEPEAGQHSEPPVEQNASNHQLAVVIFFCALGEVLLQHFLEKRMSEIGLQHEIQERLLDDNLFMKQRVQNLFPTLTGAKWNSAVEILSKRADLNYIETVKFYQRASSVRNQFLHRGNKWAIPQDMPEQCIRHIWPLVCLFVALHNEYIAQSVDEDHVSET